VSKRAIVVLVFVCLSIIISAKSTAEDHSSSKNRRNNRFLDAIDVSPASKNLKLANSVSACTAFRAIDSPPKRFNASAVNTEPVEEIVGDSPVRYRCTSGDSGNLEVNFTRGESLESTFAEVKQRGKLRAKLPCKFIETISDEDPRISLDIFKGYTCSINDSNIVFTIDAGNKNAEITLGSKGGSQPTTDGVFSLGCRVY